MRWFYRIIKGARLVGLNGINQRFLYNSQRFIPCCSFCEEYHGRPQKGERKEPVILGIETSCDDTGVAIVNGEGAILGEGYFSQADISVRFGGILPSIASKLHKKNIQTAIDDSFRKANLEASDLTAVAVTVKPGNIRTLRVGCYYAKELALQNNLPFIPIHHMEAHALTARMLHQIEFPFLALLVSGGHSQLVLASSVTEWYVIGGSVDVAVGNVFDHVARRLKLINLPGMEKVCGGRAIEMLAEEGDPKKYDSPTLMTHYRDANMSFSGTHSWYMNIINSLEQEQGIEGGQMLPQVRDICASFQYAVTKHLIRKTHRAFQYLSYGNLINPERKSLVISGGVAANQYIRRAFEKLCYAECYELYVPPPKLCTDNGIMIAWNGVERWRTQQGILYDSQSIRNVGVQHKCPLGPDLSKNHRDLNLSKPAYIKF